MYWNQPLPVQLCFLHTTNIVLIERRRTVYPVLSSNPRAIISILLRLPTLTHGCKHFSVSVIKYVRAPFVYTSVTANMEPCEDILPVTPLRFIQEWKTAFVKSGVVSLFALHLVFRRWGDCWLQLAGSSCLWFLLSRGAIKMFYIHLLPLVLIWALCLNNKK